ncbi:MAG: [Clostridia bacterium]|nr:[FeFe] hydrogenase H-cluster maturation GTPase HydF [Clostridia bacterium]
MGLQEQVSGERVHIGFFGLRNVGKSSLVNAVTGQRLSLVSEVKGTTTDPVRKAMELLPLGPVVIIDTPGLDDEGALGAQRVERAKEMLRTADAAVLVTDATRALQPAEEALLAQVRALGIPYVIAVNKADLLADLPPAAPHTHYVSAKTGAGVSALKEAIAAAVQAGAEKERGLLDGLVTAGQTVVLVTPIDSAAPKGRLILPQQQTLRALLDLGALALVTRETELAQTLALLKAPPDLVITDSQAFKTVAAIVPETVPLTSFSILFARYKGDFARLLRGVAALDTLQDGDTVLISEGCTHHRQCGDIGTEKLPAWVRAYTGKQLQFAFTSGGEFPADPAPYALVIHCGACMLTPRALQARLAAAQAAGVPMTNYGTAIAKMNGILARATAMLPEAKTE